MEGDTLRVTTDTQWDALRRAVQNSQSVTADQPAESASWSMHHDDETRQDLDEANKPAGNWGPGERPAAPEPAESPVDFSNLETPSIALSSSHASQTSEDATARRALSDLRRAARRRAASSQLLRQAIRKARMALGHGQSQPSDTQPIPSQELTSFINNLIASKQTGSTNQTTTDNTHQSHAHHTYATGETGHIDLIGNDDTYAEREPQDDDSGNISEDELAKEDTQTREGVVTSPARMSPTSPALAGSKRDARGQVRSPIERTPQDVSAMFRRPQTKPAIGLSQVFHQTQAVSSPPPTGYGDFMFERPSPDVGPARRSSPGPESSPVAVRRAPMQRAMTDPKDVYVSMRDSQERRRVREQEIQRQLDDLEDQDELSQDAEERKAELRRQKAAIAAETTKLFAKIDVPSSRRKDRRRKIIEGDPWTPAVQKGKTGHPIVISDDTPKAQLDGNVDFSDKESDAGSRDEYDELSQAVVNIPRSSAKKRPRDQLGDHRPSSSPVHPSNGARQGFARDSRATRSFHPGSYIHARSSNAENNLPSQTMQVPYSQPGTIDPTDSLPARPPRPMLVSSMDSRTFVSQSQQDFSLSSTTRQQIHDMPQEISSSIPRPPPFDDEEDDDTAGAVRSSPPSSPPLAGSQEVDHEHDIQMKLDHAEGEAGVLDDQPPESVVRRHKLEAQEAQLANSISNEDQPTASPMHPPKRRPLRRIPDTSPASTTASARAPGLEHAGESANPGSSHQRSNSTGAFETARTHLTGEEPTASTHSQPGPSPRKVRNLRSIQLGPTPPDLNGDVDAVIDVLNEGNDDGFDAAMMGPVDRQPPKKRLRRNVSTTKVLHEPSQAKNKLPQPSEEATPKRTAPQAATAMSPRQTRQSEQEHPQLPEAPASIAPSEASSRATVSSIKPVVSGSLQRNIVGTNSQWTERRPTRFEMQAEAAKVQEAQNSAPVQQRRDTPSLAVDTTSATNVDPRLAQRVLARFKDRKISFYPATCLGPGFGEKKVKIRFDDGNVDEEAPEHLVKSFELKPGNQVRIDMAGHRNKTFVVQDVKDKLSVEQSARRELLDTDIHGNTKVVVAAKAAPSKEDAGEGVAESFEVPISKIWIQSTNWAQFAGRPFEPPTAASSARLATPTNVLSAPNTPSSRSRRRTTFSTTQLQPSLKDASFRTESSVGLFANMAFAISVSGSDDEKATLTRLIRSNGGSILSTNFDALFEPDAAATGKSTPVSSPIVGGDLKLTSSAKDLGFVALITDNHNRREKYVQALALDIPCLSYRWIHDSVSKEKLQAWDRYLLPAGESTLLHGAVRSRTMIRPSYDASTVTLQDTVAQRPKLLEDRNVLLVVGKGKAEERKKAFIFLTYALGARRVERVKNLVTAKTSLELPDAPWDFVYVDAGELDDAAARLTGRTPGGKKRKRKSAAPDTSEKLSVTVQTGGRSVKVVGDEFVVQSLILGALVEEA